MSNVTRILTAIEQGDPAAAEQLRKLAAQKMREEKPGQTLQATVLVHEAYIRLVGGKALDALGQEDPRAAELVKLRYFAGGQSTGPGRLIRGAVLILGRTESQSMP